MRAIILLFFLLSFLVSPFNCFGTEQEREKVTIQLKWFHQFQFAGYYAALEKGFYAEEGLEVNLRQRVAGTSHLYDVLEGRAQYGVADAGGLLTERLQGKPVVLIAQIFQHSPLVLTTLAKSGIRSAKDLAGKHITLDVVGHSDLPIFTMLINTLGGLDAVEIHAHSFNPQDLIDGKTDAYGSYITNHPDWYRQQGLTVNIIDPRDYGIDFYGDNLFTTEQELREHPQRVEKIRRASLKGWRYALDNREEMIDLILEKYNSQNTSRSHLAYEARETEKLIVRDVIEIGSFNPTRYQKLVKNYAKMEGIADAMLEPSFFYQTEVVSERISLTAAQQRWLQEHPVIRWGYDVNWPPVEWLTEKNKVIGISADYLQLIEKKLGINIEPVTPRSWSSMLDAARAGEVDIISTFTATPQRKEFLDFTDPYLHFPMVIATRNDVSYINNMLELLDKKVGVQKGDIAQDIISSNHPEIKLAPFNAVKDGLLSVVEGETFAFIGSLAAISHIIAHEGLGNIKISGQSPYAYNTAMAVRKDQPHLLSALQKALNSITEEERADIYRKWLSLTIEHKFDYTLLWNILAVVTIVLSLFLYWNRRLAREVVARQQAEIALLGAKNSAEAANKAKSTFLANMSHELRTPLNIVLGFSNLMARVPHASTDNKQNLALINRSGQHLLSIINDVLDMSKIEAGHIKLEPEHVNLHLQLHDIGDMIKLRAETKELQFSVKLAPDLPQHILLDKGKLRQVLINLLGNAVKFTDQGNIILSSDAKKLNENHWILYFEIEDTGIGIPADEIESIFEPFVQSGHSPTKQQGTGLGLTISRQFIELMGGKISVESTLDKGSTFRFEIPVKTTDVDNIEASTHKTQQRVLRLADDETEWRILIVEDMDDNRLLLKNLLTSVGFTICEAVNGEEAIKQYTDWQPHLIWMDMRMPVMDGYEATRRIRELPGGKEVKILALTASAFKEQEKEILAVGCDAVIHKPYDEMTIYMAMAEQLELHYIFEEVEKLSTSNDLSKLNFDDLVNMPEKWLDDFLTTAYLGDTEALLTMTKALPVSASATKAKLDSYIKEFQLKALITILEENRQPKGKA